MKNVIYVGLGNDLHYGGIAEWTYRMGYWLSKSGYKLKVLSNTNVPKPFTGTYDLIYIPCHKEVRFMGNYYAMDLANCFQKNLQALLKLLHSVPIIITYDPLMGSYVSTLLGIKVFWYSHIHELLYRRVTSFIKSKETIDMLLSLLKYVHVLTQHELNKSILSKYAEDVDVLTIPVAPEYFKYNPHPEDYIVYSAGFDQSKNPGLVLQVFKKLSDFKVYIIGGRGYSKLRSLNLKNVEVLGHLDRDEYYKMISRAFASFQCSLVEAFSINTMDNGWFHPMILPAKPWASYWSPMPKAKNAREYVELIKKLYSSENYYSSVVMEQRNFIKKYHNPKLFINQWEIVVKKYISRGKRSKKVDEVMSKCKSDIISCLKWLDYVTGYKYLLAYYDTLIKLNNKSWW